MFSLFVRSADRYRWHLHNIAHYWSLALSGVCPSVCPSVTLCAHCWIWVVSVILTRGPTSRRRKLQQLYAVHYSVHLSWRHSLHFRPQRLRWNQPHSWWLVTSSSIFRERYFVEVYLLTTKRYDKTYSFCVWRRCVKRPKIIINVNKRVYYEKRQTLANVDNKGWYFSNGL